jgi:hypothetical protein
MAWWRCTSSTVSELFTVPHLRLLLLSITQEVPCLMCLFYCFYSTGVEVGIPYPFCKKFGLSNGNEISKFCHV